MNKWCGLFFILFFFCAVAQLQAGPLVITRDSLGKKKFFSLKKDWRFCKKDSAVFASVSYNDSGWNVRDADIRTDSELITAHGYKSRVDWYRLHFYADTSIAGFPLAVLMYGYGAAEVYLDGNRIQTYGTIRPGGKSKFVSLEMTPFIIAIRNAGPHLLSVRFVNFISGKNVRNEDDCLTGFQIKFSKTDNIFLSGEGAIINNMIVLAFIGTLFLVLAVVHLLLFVYYRAVWSNLYFSIFCFSLSAFIFFLYLNAYGNDPEEISICGNIISPIVVAIAFYSFSGLNNELFSRRKIFQHIVAVLAVLCIAINFWNDYWGSIVYAITGGIVLLEALVLPVAGIYRRVQGARIVGFGVLFFAVFTTVVIILLFVKKSVEFNTSNIEERLFTFFALCATLSIPFSMSVYLSRNFAIANRELKKNLQQVQILSQQTLEQELEKKRIIQSQKEKLEEEVAERTTEIIAQKERIEKQHEDLKKEKQKSDDLLLNILPSEVAEELKQRGNSEAKYFDDVTILFTDFVNFTNAGELMTPKELVNELNTCFRAFDEITSRHNIEKIKTIGDAYLGVCGLPLPVADHAAKTVAAALEIKDFMQERKALIGDLTFDIRIGIHSGSVVAGIVGVKKFAYDVWGDAVNTAARIEQNSMPGKINISQTTYDLVKEQFECTMRGKVVAKNKGELLMYFVEAPKKHLTLSRNDVGHA